MTELTELTEFLGKVSHGGRKRWEAEGRQDQISKFFQINGISFWGGFDGINGIETKLTEFFAGGFARRTRRSRRMGKAGDGVAGTSAFPETYV